jgi:DNA recombination protein RmuC
MDIQSTIEFNYYFLASGFVSGFLIAFFYFKAKLFRLHEKSRTAAADQAVLAERLNAKEERIIRLDADLWEKKREMENVQKELRNNVDRKVELEVRIDEERKKNEAQFSLLKDAREELSQSFKAISSDIFVDNSKSFLNLAKETLAKYQEHAKGDLASRKAAIDNLVKPLHESLEKVNVQMRSIEKERVEAYAGLSEQVKLMAVNQTRLQGETANLVKALRTPTVRGRWGEMQLRRVVEMAGMVAHCDFVEQKSVESEKGRLRPDMLINLPNGKNIIVDSKVALQAYLEAQDADEETVRQARMEDHARQVKTHLVQLGSKSYWEQFQTSPEFVVMFVPGENFFSAALKQDPELIEYGVSHRVILATPTTLIALLRAVSYGWSQEQIAEHAERIGVLGRELHGRLLSFTGHFSDLRKQLDRAVDSYNRAVGSLESRVLVSARKFNDLDSTIQKDIPQLTPIDKKARVFN